MLVDVALTVTLNVAVVAHCPELGVKVQLVVPGNAVLTVEFQVPIIGVLFVELVGNKGGTEF